MFDNVIRFNFPVWYYASPSGLKVESMDLQIEINKKRWLAVKDLFCRLCPLTSFWASIALVAVRIAVSNLWLFVMVMYFNVLVWSPSHGNTHLDTKYLETPSSSNFNQGNLSCNLVFYSSTMNISWWHSYCFCASWVFNAFFFLRIAGNNDQNS